MLADTFASFSFPSAGVNSASGFGAARKSKMDEMKERERRSCSRSPILHGMDIDEKESPFVKHHQAGLRISSFHRQVAPIA